MQIVSFHPCDLLWCGACGSGDPRACLATASVAAGCGPVFRFPFREQHLSFVAMRLPWLYRSRALSLACQ